MKHLLVSLGLGLLATTAVGQKIDPATTLPWMNGGTDGEFKLADHPNGVFVFEAYELSCAFCNQNAPQVDALAVEYKNDARVTVVDLGQDTADRDYRNWIATHSPNHPVVKDVGQKVFSALKQDDGIPQTFVVAACDGSLAGSTLGLWGDAKKTLTEAITKTEKIACN